MQWKRENMRRAITPFHVSHCNKGSLLTCSSNHEKIRGVKTSRVTFIYSCKKQQAKKIQQEDIVSLPLYYDEFGKHLMQSRSVRRNKHIYQRHVKKHRNKSLSDSTNGITRSSSHHLISQVPIPTRAYLFIQGRKAKLNQRERRQKMGNKRHEVIPMIPKAKKQPMKSNTTVCINSMIFKKPALEKRASCTSLSLRKVAEEQGLSELDEEKRDRNEKKKESKEKKKESKEKKKQNKEKKEEIKEKKKEIKEKKKQNKEKKKESTEKKKESKEKKKESTEKKKEIKEKKNTQLAEENKANIEATDENEKPVTKNEKIFQRRGKQIKIRLPSPNDDGNEVSIGCSNQICNNKALESESDKNQVRRVYLVNPQSPFGGTKIKSFTVLFPDEVEKIPITKLPSSNPVSPGWLSPVPYSMLDLSLAYFTPEHSPLASPSPTMDHICRLKPSFFKK